MSAGSLRISHSLALFFVGFADPQKRWCGGEGTLSLASVCDRAGDEAAKLATHSISELFKLKTRYMWQYIEDMITCTYKGPPGMTDSSNGPRP